MIPCLDGVRLGFDLYHEKMNVARCRCQTHHARVTRPNAQEASRHQTEQYVQSPLRPPPQELPPSDPPILVDQPRRAARRRGPLRILAARPAGRRERRDCLLERARLAGTPHRDLSRNGRRCRAHRSDDAALSLPPPLLLRPCSLFKTLPLEIATSRRHAWLRSVLEPERRQLEKKMIHANLRRWS